jgi:hypothetical protein
MAKPTRTFSANVGQKSTGNSGPDAIETDIDAINKMFDPIQAGGGIGTENLQDGAATDNIIGNRTVDQTLAGGANTGTPTQLLSWIVKQIFSLKGGVSNWYDSAVASISTIWGKFNASTGHGHTGATDDAPQIGTSGIANDAVTTGKIASGAVTDSRITGPVTGSKVTGIPTASINDGAVTTQKIATGAVTSDKLDPALIQDVELNTHRLMSTLDHPDNSVTDAKIGNRTISDASAPTGDTGTATTLFGWLANMIKSITGKPNWRTAPDASLEAASANIANVDSHISNTTNAHGIDTIRTNSAQALVLETRSGSDPTSPAVGRIWLRTDI